MDKEYYSKKIQTLHLLSEKLKIARKMCWLSLIMSVITMIIGIIVSCYYVNKLDVRGIFIALLVVSGVSISSLMGSLSKCIVICRENLKE